MAPTPTRLVDAGALAALAVGAVPGAVVFFAAQALAFQTICLCPGARTAGTIACACLGVFVALGTAEALLRRRDRARAAAGSP